MRFPPHAESAMGEIAAEIHKNGGIAHLFQICFDLSHFFKTLFQGISVQVSPFLCVCRHWLDREQMLVSHAVKCRSSAGDGEKTEEANAAVKKRGKIMSAGLR